MIDKMMNITASLMEKAAQWLTFPSIPWDKFKTNWFELIDMIAPWNKIFPITEVLIIFGLIFAVFGALILFYGVLIVKSFIPFMGGK